MLIQDFESGWTALHRSIYFGNLNVTLLLIKAGSSLDDTWRTEDWMVPIRVTKEPRSLRNISKWRSPIDNDGLSPLDLLSLMGKNELADSKYGLFSTTTLYAFGKSDFMLGVPLSKSDTVRPKRIELIASNITYIMASKYHSAALTCGGLYVWGHGRSGRLGISTEKRITELSVSNSCSPPLHPSDRPRQ